MIFGEFGKMEFFALFFAVSIIFGSIQLAKKNKIKEEYSILWILMGIVFIIISLNREIIDIVGHFFGIKYTPIFLILIIISFILLILIHFSILISDLSNKNRELIQEMAILKFELENKK